MNMIARSLKNGLVFFSLSPQKRTDARRDYISAFSVWLVSMISVSLLRDFVLKKVNRVLLADQTNSLIWWTDLPSVGNFAEDECFYFSTVTVLLSTHLFSKITRERNVMKQAWIEAREQYSWVWNLFYTFSCKYVNPVYWWLHFTSWHKH